MNLGMIHLRRGHLRFPLGQGRIKCTGSPPSPFFSSSRDNQHYYHLTACDFFSTKGVKPMARKPNVALGIVINDKLNYQPVKYDRQGGQPV